MPVNKQLQVLIENIANDHGLSKEQLEKAIVDAIHEAAKKSVTRPVEDLTVEMNKGDIRIVGRFEVVDKMPIDNCGKIELAEIQAKIDEEKMAARFKDESEKPKASSFASKEARKAAELERQKKLKEKYDAIEKKYNFSVGDIIPWEITPANFGRIAANNVKQAIDNFIRRAERKSICDSYKRSVEQLVQCTFLRTERAKIQKKDSADEENAPVRSAYNTIVLVDDKYEGIIPAEQCVPGERFEFNERFRAILLETNELDSANEKYALTLSRTSELFVKRIMAENVTEINDGTVEIRKIARKPGIRTKVVVTSNSSRVDPIGACLGRKGNILRSITDALRSNSRLDGRGERVDIIRYSENFEDFAKAVLKPAEVESLERDDKNSVLTIRVAKGNNSKAIGVNGCNVSLAGAILHYKIVVREENEEDMLAKAIDSVIPEEPTAGELDAQATSTTQDVPADGEAKNMFDKVIPEEPAAEEPVIPAVPPTPEFLAAKEKAKNEFKLVFGISDDDAEKLFVTGHMIVEGIKTDLQALPSYRLSEDALKKINAHFGQNIQD